MLPRPAAGTPLLIVWFSASATGAAGVASQSVAVYVPIALSKPKTVSV